jgi:uncharacterized protein YfiM (DUF2279 family)
MTLLSAEITELRYDIRDENATQYSDAMLTAYYKRVVRAMDDWLAKVKSDWVLSTDTLTLLSAGTSVALPSDFNSARSVQIGSDYEDLDGATPEWIYQQQLETSSGQPEYYAIHKLNMIFERAAGAEYSIYLKYNQRQAILTTASDMPYSDRFNDTLRAAVEMIARNRNERAITGTYALYDLFSKASTGTAVNRRTIKKTRLGY